MLQLVNLSNDASDLHNLLDNSPVNLLTFLQAHHLDGIEFMRCAPWNPAFYPREIIKGVHLWFYTNWLDFFLGNEAGLRQEFCDAEAVRYAYGGEVSDWLALLRLNVRQAAELKPAYVVFHVANVRPNEMYSRRFHYDSAQVISATARLANLICADLPADISLLYENLWWPGLTFTEPQLAAELLAGTAHQNTGFMLDTGHLMNTCPALRTQAEGVDYVLRVLEWLGPLAAKVRGLHLHYSLSGETMQRLQAEHANDAAHPFGWQEIYAYITAIDRHLPFSDPEAKKIIRAVNPDYLVHEFIQQGRNDWEQKLSCQQTACALG